MRIEDLRQEAVEGRCRLSARLVGEGRYRGPDVLWYDVEPEVAADVAPVADAFLLAATPLAIRWGEPRLAVDAPVCPRLFQGLEGLARVLEHWTPERPRVPLEARGGFALPEPAAGGRTAAFVSGGVDSLSLLRANRRTYPLGHPASIAEGFFVLGLGSFDFVGDALDPDRRRAWEEQEARLRRFAAATGWTLRSVGTNARTLYPDFQAWTYHGFGPSTVAVAHLFRRRVRAVHLASHGYGAAQGRYSSHPLIDPLMSSAAVEVHTGEPMRLRHEKLADVASWDEALEVLQVCFMHEAPPPGAVNCGRCEKCLRTMMGLLALGRLGAASTFPRRDLAPADLARYRPSGDPDRIFSGPLVEGLARAGRADLARALSRRIAHADRRERRRASWWWRAWRRATRGGGPVRA